MTKSILRILILTPLLAALAGCIEERRIPPAVGDRWTEARVPRYAGQSTAQAATAPNAAALRVGLLLPLTGPDQALGAGLLNAATLAVFESGSTRAVELAPRDTGGTAEGAGAAAIAALAAGAEALLGPVDAEVAAYPVDAATAAATPTLLLSADRTLAAPGVFAAGIAPEAGATRVLDFAYRQGVRRVALLAPPTARGQAAARGLEGAAFARQMEIARAEFISADAPAAAIETAVRDAMRSLGPGGALFLPYPASQTAPFAAALEAVEIADRPLLMGLADWGDPSIAAHTAFEGAVFAGPDPAPIVAFSRRYTASFGSAPPPGAALVYDMTAMLAAAGAGAAGRGFGTFDLTAGPGFVGVEGPFRVGRDGVVERRLAIVGVRNGRFQVLEPASTRFGS